MGRFLYPDAYLPSAYRVDYAGLYRSEERRVGKECL